MRAPPLARMAAVAAPRPDAEPVTIAHKPSFDIRISSYCLEPTRCCSVALYHIAQPGGCKSDKLRYAELIPAPHAPLRTALVTAMAFAHHKAQEKIKKIAHPRAWRN